MYNHILFINKFNFFCYFNKNLINTFKFINSESFLSLKKKIYTHLIIIKA
jgi:hypothetical protein